MMPKLMWCDRVLAMSAPKESKMILSFARSFIRNVRFPAAQSSGTRSKLMPNARLKSLGSLAEKLSEAVMIRISCAEKVLQ